MDSHDIARTFLSVIAGDMSFDTELVTAQYQMK